MGGKWGERCPRCGAVASAQRHKPRTVDYSRLNPAGIFNPVDAVLCPYCGEAFRVMRKKTWDQGKDVKFLCSKQGMYLYLGT